MTTSPLLDWIKRAEESGTADSKDHSARKSELEELIAFQLSNPNGWVLKLLQLANRVGSDLRVRQTRTETTFSYTGFEGWSAPQFERAILGTGESSPELGHLAVALRLLISSGQPFTLEAPGQECDSWEGQSFEPSSPQNVTDFTVTISHFKAGESTWFLSTNNFAARRRMVNIGQQVKEFGPFALVDITLDRLDVVGLFRDHRFGVRPSSCPLKVWSTVTNPELPAFQIRTGPVKALSPLHGVLEAELDHLENRVLEVGAVGLLTSFFDRRRSGSHGWRYECRKRHSQLVWLRDGVVLSREKLPHCGSVAASVMVSAEGLETDASTLSPSKTPALSRRRLAALGALSDWLRNSWDDYDRRRACQTLAGLAEGHSGGLTSKKTQVMDMLRRDMEYLAEYNFVQAAPT